MASFPVTGLFVLCLCTVSLTQVLFPESNSTQEPELAARCPDGTLCVERARCDTNLTTISCGVASVCCSLVDTGVRANQSIIFPPESDEEDSDEITPKVTEADIRNAIDTGLKFSKHLDELENELEKMQLFSDSQSPSSAHQNFFGSSVLSRKLSRDGQIAMNATIEMAKKFQVQGRSLRKFSFVDTVIKNRCPKPRPCISTKYRSLDGSCNNLKKPDWGQTLTPFSRLLVPDYGDGVDSPRRASVGRTLPSARSLSLVLSAGGRNVSHAYLTNFFMNFGQFLDHDMTSTLSTRPQNGQAISCCDARFDRNPRLIHPACFAIRIPPQDPVYGRIPCMSFVRSAPAVRPSCIIGPREQVNQLSAFIDGSMIYGTSTEMAQVLRSFKGGRLISSSVNGNEFLPESESTCAIPAEVGRHCFAAGDGRVNIQPNLVVMHSIWLRQHNQVAGVLSSLNPDWDDETLYQESRRIVIGQLQHVTYREFLPLLIGKQTVETFGLSAKNSSLNHTYEANLNPGILSSFSSAAFRLHTLIPGSMELRTNENKVVDKVKLSDTFNDPSLVYDTDAVTNLVNGLSGQAAANFDRFFSPEISSRLFRQRGTSLGLDLVAINIQRGRDHGIPGYNRWRKACSQSRLNRFQDLTTIMDKQTAFRLSQLYRHVDDIDLFVGGVSEEPMEGAVVGPTFACIIGEQFRRLKYGDRFWYENKDHGSSFSQDQINEIKKTSLSRIVCDNIDGLEKIQPLSLIKPLEPWNTRVDCNSETIPRLDFRKWMPEKKRSDEGWAWN
ncbi:Chorion peroxidase [Halotydeus destructor]|nr:Chorion peroxidase [Halotydeus destructor]